MLRTLGISSQSSPSEVKIELISVKISRGLGRCSRTVISETIEKEVFPSVVDFKDVVLKKLPLGITERQLSI